MSGTLEDFAGVRIDKAHDEEGRNLIGGVSVLFEYALTGGT